MKNIALGQIPRQGNPFVSDPNFKGDSPVEKDLINKVLQELEDMDRKKYSAFKAYGEIGSDKQEQ